jgi:hypothetical protein
MLLSLSTCPWQDSSLSRTRIPLLRLRSADPLCVARNADRSLPSAILDVRPQNGLRNKTPKASARRACFRLCWCGPKDHRPMRLFLGRGATGRRNWRQSAMCRCRIADLTDAQALEMSHSRKPPAAGRASAGGGAGLRRSSCALEEPKPIPSNSSRPNAASSPGMWLRAFA